MSSITTRSTLKSSLNVNDAIFQAERAQVPAYAPEWIGGVTTGIAAGDTDGDWLDVTGSTLINVQIVPSGTFAGSVQASLDGGKTFANIVNVGGTDGLLSAAGIYSYRGAYQYIRVHTSAIEAAKVIKVSVSFVLD